MKNIHQHIIEKCRQGDISAQFELYRLYCKNMYNVCIQLIGHIAEAEDILQEAFLKAYTQLHQYNESVTFGAWLKRIVINHSIDYLRKNKLDTEKIEEVKFEGKEDLNIYIEINYEKLHEALALLPDNHRVVFTLFVLEGYDHEEIAEILRINYNTSRSHLARAKAKLRQLLQKETLTSV